MAAYKSAPHTFTKDGVFYFVRRVPAELQKHYTSQKIAYSLRTKSVAVAAARAIRAASQLDEYWFHLRAQDAELPGKHMLRLNISKPAPSSPPDQASVTIDEPKLSDCVAIYIRLKGSGKPQTFRSAAERSCGYVIDVCGDKALSEYTRKDANAFRDALVARGMAGSSITRILGTVRAVTNFAASEEGLTLTNPFGGVYYDRTAGVVDRLPIPVDSIRKIQAICYQTDDEMRWLVALIADTGMRLAEAAGLLLEDFGHDDNGYYVHVQPHQWRRLKTTSSARTIPFVGSSVWAAQRLLQSGRTSGFAFPRYNKTGQTNANAASAGLNKWLKPHVHHCATMHGFRHSMRDRLRAVECPADVVDQIGGWQTEGVGHGYGRGYPLNVLRRWLETAVKPT